MGTQAAKNLENDGYRFTGIYASCKGDVVERAAELRKDGYLARIVLVPPSKYARGDGRTGYSVYSKPTARKAKELAEQKIAEELLRSIDLASIKIHLLEMTGAELMDILVEAKGSEAAVLQWARKETIIK